MVDPLLQLFIWAFMVSLGLKGFIIDDPFGLDDKAFNDF